MDAIVNKLNQKLRRVALMKQHVNTNMDRFRQTQDFIEAIRCWMDSAVEIYEMIILVRPYCEGDGTVPDAFGDIILRARGMHRLIERMIVEAETEATFANRRSITNGRSIGTQTDIPQLCEAFAQTSVSLSERSDQLRDEIDEGEEMVASEGALSDCVMVEDVSALFDTPESHDASEMDAHASSEGLNARSPPPKQARWSDEEVDNAPEPPRAGPSNETPEPPRAGPSNETPGEPRAEQPDADRSKGAIPKAYRIPRRSEQTAGPSSANTRGTPEMSEAEKIWDAYKATHANMDKADWKFNRAYRGYYMFCNEKAAKRPIGRYKDVGCRYCYIFGRAAAHYMHACDAFKSLPRCERIIWVEVLDLCHNCFSSFHSTEQCARPNGCSCKTRTCQCESQHKHNSLLCGGRRRDLPGARPADDWGNSRDNTRDGRAHNQKERYNDRDRRDGRYHRN